MDKDVRLLITMGMAEGVRLPYNTLHRTSAQCNDNATFNQELLG